MEYGCWMYEGDKVFNEGDKKIFVFWGYYNVVVGKVCCFVVSGS